jgi:hypothetical protein
MQLYNGCNTAVQRRLRHSCPATNPQPHHVPQKHHGVRARARAQKTQLLGDVRIARRVQFLVQPRRELVQARVLHTAVCSGTSGMCKETLKPVSHFLGSRVKNQTRRFSKLCYSRIAKQPSPQRRGERSRAQCHTACNLYSAPPVQLLEGRGDGPLGVHRAVALHVAFERQTLKPVFHLIGYRLWLCKAIGYGLWVNLRQPAEPHRAHRHAQLLPRVRLEVLRKLGLL